MRVLKNPSPAQSEYFGTSVAISGSHVVVGAGGDHDGDVQAGTAYVYDLESSEPTLPLFTLHNPTPAPDDGFGYAVAISGTRVVVGASSDDTGAYDAGSVYVYDFAGATPSAPIQTMVNPSGWDGMAEYFGTVVAISGERVVVGAPWGNTGEAQAGSAYVYDLSSPSSSQPVLTLRRSTPLAYEHFGTSVAISGERVAIGAPSANVLVYDLSTTSPEVPALVLDTPGRGEGNDFGRSIAIEGATLVAAAPYDNTAMLERGAVYIYGPERVGQAVDDAITLTMSESRVYPLANDLWQNSDTRIVGVAGTPGVRVSQDGRAVIVGGTGTFSYITNHSTSATVRVKYRASSLILSRWEGLLYDVQGGIAGIARVTRTGSQYTAVVTVGRSVLRLNFAISDIHGASVHTRAGQFTANLAANWTLDVAVGTNRGKLPLTFERTNRAQYNIALASIDPNIVGGGYARAVVHRDAGITVAGKLPDGRAITCSSRLLENDTFVVYRPIAGGMVAGELVIADLAATDVTGELAWKVLPHGPRGERVDTILTANGCLFTPGFLLPNGVGSLKLASSGGFQFDRSEERYVFNGTPGLTPFVPSWTAHPATGTFTAKARLLSSSPTMQASGVYLPKDKRAWGYFPGRKTGGRIEFDLILAR